MLFQGRKFAYITAFSAVMLLWADPTCAQIQDSSSVNRQGRKVVVATVAAYGATAGLLYSTWYRDYPQGKFHFFNDADEWLWMDKAGHTASAYYLSRWNARVFRSAGVSQDRSALYGTLTGYGFLLGVEVMDGFSSQWGFSVPDLAANSAGALLFYLQEQGWKEQRIAFHLSVRPTRYARLRPELLGSTVAERILKDYNGQTYWLSVNPSSFMAAGSRFPKWLNIAVGYGAEGMLGGSSNPEAANGMALPKMERYRQFYLSPDIDLTRLPFKSRFLKTLTELFGFIKFPAPALEINTKGKTVFHGIYF